MASLAELLKRKTEDEVLAARIGTKVLGEGTAKGLGRMGATIDAQLASHRIHRLKHELNAGEIDSSTLSPYEQRLIGAKYLNAFNKVPQPGEGSSTFLGIGGPVGEATSNFFKEAASMGQHLPGGIVSSVVSGVKDAPTLAQAVTNPTGALAKLAQGEGENPIPNTTENILAPTVEAYKEKYGQGSLGEIAKRALIEEPFGTVLDAGTLLTAGAGAAGKTGAIAARAGSALEAADEGSTLGRVGEALRTGGNKLKGFGYKGTRGTRPDLDMGRGIPSMPREYGASPAVRFGQKLTDKYLERIPGAGEKLADWRQKFAGFKEQRMQAGRERLNSVFNMVRESKPVREAEKALGDKEAVALHFLKNGVNDAPARPRGGTARGMMSMVESHKEFLDAAHEGTLPSGYNVRDMPNVDPEYNRLVRASLDDPEVTALISNPTEKMINASNVWDREVDKNLERMGIQPEEYEARKWNPGQILRVKPENLEDAIKGVETGDEITSVLDPAGSFDRYAAKVGEQTGKDFPIAPNYIPHEIADGTFKDLTNVDRLKHDNGVKLHESLVRQGSVHLSKTDLKAFVSGAVRMDSTPLIKQIADRERLLARNNFLDEFERSNAKRGPDGEVMRVSDDAFRNMQFPDKDKYQTLDIEGEDQYFKEERAAVKMIAEAGEALRHKVPGEINENLDNIIDSAQAALEGSAEKASLSIPGRSQSKRIIVRKDQADYLRKNLQSFGPADSQYARVYDRLMNGWRGMLLALSPRWWINTFVGSGALTILAGAARPKYLGAALRYGPGEKLANLERKLGDSAAGHVVGRVADRIGGSEERAAQLQEATPEFGVGGLYGGELGETEFTHGRAGKRHPIRTVFHKVDQVEQVFKRMGLMHAMDKEAKAAMHQMDEVFDDYKSIGKMSDGYIKDMMENHPMLVRHSVDNANKFYYNYTLMGPTERRIIRRVIPFWGWYKFITRLMYQLPFQYPARTNVLNHLGAIGKETESELGLLPPSLKGAIFLNHDRDNLNYIPTFGLNPFSDFANPAAPEGTLAGLISNQQFTPLLGAFLQSAGVDPYSGAPLELSPGSGILQGSFGTAINPETGEEIPGGIGAALSGDRFLGALMRTVPQLKTLETLQAGGRYVYPDSIPLLDVKPVPVPAGEAYGGATPLGYVAQSFVGALPARSENLRDYQQQLNQEIESGKKKRKSQLEDLRKEGVTP